MNLPRVNSLLVNHREGQLCDKERAEVVFFDFRKAHDPIYLAVIISKSMRYGRDKRTIKCMEVQKDFWQLILVIFLRD